MKLSATAPFCFAATVFTSRCCFAADSSHLRRERERNGDLLLIVDTVRSSGRRVNQVYLEQPPGSADNNIQIPKESIPLTLLSSQADQTPRRELSFWSSIFSELFIPLHATASAAASIYGCFFSIFYHNIFTHFEVFLYILIDALHICPFPDDHNSHCHHHHGKSQACTIVDFSCS